MILVSCMAKSAHPAQEPEPWGSRIVGRRLFFRQGLPALQLPGPLMASSLSRNFTWKRLSRVTISGLDRHGHLSPATLKGRIHHWDGGKAEEKQHLWGFTFPNAHQNKKMSARILFSAEQGTGMVHI